MVTRPLVLCPTDFSTASRGALRYAAAVAEHFYADLMVVTVDDPLLAGAAAIRFGPDWMRSRTLQGLEAFVKDTFHGHPPRVADLKLEAQVGHPATAILQCAQDHRADLIVMGSHGRSGARKLLLGSTAERVLRDTRLPVVISPGSDPGPQSLDDIRRAMRTVLVPIDFSSATLYQVLIARGLAESLGASVVLAHMLAPLVGRGDFEALLAGVDEARRRDAAADLTRHNESLPRPVRQAIRLSSGDPATEIVRAANECKAGVIVMGLHSSVEGGPRMGSITYRVLCHAPCPVLALAPTARASAMAAMASDREKAPAPA
jgi:nucleotide-binding universal stress UspA family protein